MGSLRDAIDGANRKIEEEWAQREQVEADLRANAEAKESARKSLTGDALFAAMRILEATAEDLRVRSGRLQEQIQGKRIILSLLQGAATLEAAERAARHEIELQRERAARLRASAERKRAEARRRRERGEEGADELEADGLMDEGRARLVDEQLVGKREILAILEENRRPPPPGGRR